MAPLPCAPGTSTGGVCGARGSGRSDSPDSKEFLAFDLEIPSPKVKLPSSRKLHLESEKRSSSGEVPVCLGPEPKPRDRHTGHSAVQGRGPDQVR